MEAVQAAQYKYRSMMFKLYKVEIALPLTEFRRNKLAIKVSPNAPNLKVIASTPGAQSICDSSTITPPVAPVVEEEGKEVLMEGTLEASPQRMDKVKK